MSSTIGPRPKGSIIPKLTGMTYAKAEELARHVEETEGWPPKGSLSELLRNDYLDSGAGDSVTFDLITLALRTHHADWITRENVEMEAALVNIFVALKEGAAPRDVARIAWQAMSTESRERLRREGPS